MRGNQSLFLSIVAFVGVLALGLSGPAVAQTTELPEIQLQSGHAVSLLALKIAVSPDGRWIASVSADGAVKIWDTATGWNIRTLHVPHSGKQALAISPRGDLIATASGDGIVRLWNVRSGRQVQAIVFAPEMAIARMKVPLNAVAFAMEGRFVAAGSQDGTVAVWDAESGKEVVRPAGRGMVAGAAVNSLACSQNGALLAWGDFTGTLRVWDFRAGRIVHQVEVFKNGAVNALAFSRDGRILAAGGGVVSTPLKGPWETKRAEVWLWETEKWKKSVVIDANDNKSSGFGISEVALTPDGRFLACTNASGIGIWEIGNSRRVTILEGFAGRFAPDGRWLASLRGNTITLLDWRTNEVSMRIQQATPLPAMILRLSHGMDRMLTLGMDPRSMVKEWDLATGGLSRAFLSESPAKDVREGNAYAEALKRVVEGGSVIDISSDTQWIAAAAKRSVALWDGAAAREVANWSTAKDAAYLQVKVSPDGREIATVDSANAKVVDLWDVSSKKQVRTLTGSFSLFDWLEFSLDGRYLAASFKDAAGPGEVVVWRRADGSVAWRLPFEETAVNSYKRIAISPDGQWLARSACDYLGNPCLVSLWSLSDGKRLWTDIKTAFGLHGPLAFSPDGTRLAVGDVESVKIFEIPSGRIALSLAAGASDPVWLAFSPDRRLIFTTSLDGGIHLWDAQSGELLAIMRTTLGGLDWIVATPSGLFDGSPAAFRQVLWRFNRDTFDVAPVESFFGEFYYPGLLAEIIAGKRPRAPRDIKQLDRRLPRVALKVSAPGAAPPGSSRTLTVQVEVGEAPGDETLRVGSGARDVRLFRNGTLVKVWRGDALAGKTGSATLETTVSIVAGENTFTAYAFNRDNVKSLDATLSVTGAESLRRRGVAYVLAVGLNRYANRDYDLRFAVADAKSFNEEFARSQRDLNTYERVEVVELLDQDATKANILAALNRLRGAELPPGAPPALTRLAPAQPEDAVVMFFSGHGTAQRDRFYLIPHDLGHAGGRDALNEEALAALLSHSISDLDLEMAFESIDAGQFVLVIDACNSGQALEAEEKRRGPMNSRGLAQLAYEKGMNILTAAQGYQVALETAQLGHGFLTYALVEEGLKQAAADQAPEDGSVVLREWLDYAVERVPEIHHEMIGDRSQPSRGVQVIAAGKKRDEAQSWNVQRPRVFYRREPEPVPLVITKVAPRTAKVPRSPRP